MDFSNGMRRLGLALVMALALGAGAASAAGDSERVRSLIGKTWDKPGARVVTDPVVVASGWALAGWTQGDRGGRALLQRQDGSWSVVLCAGAAFTRAEALAEAGVPPATARRLARDLAAAEARLTPERRRQFDLFGPPGAQPLVHHAGHGEHAPAATEGAAAQPHGHHDHGQHPHQH